MTSPVGAVLSDPDYRRLFVSGLFVNVARWVDLVTLGWLALQLTGSPFLVALAAFARTAPLMVVGLFTGIVADRVSRARLLVVAQSVAAATALLLALVFGSGLGGYNVLIACEVVLGLTWTLDFPARRTSLYSLLGAARVAQAVSLGSVLVAPALLIALSGSRWLALGVVLLFLTGFAAMQTTPVLLSVPDRVRGGVMGILSACIGTQPLGTLTIGLLVRGWARR
jgi:MFS family permease